MLAVAVEDDEVVDTAPIGGLEGRPEGRPVPFVVVVFDHGRARVVRTGGGIVGTAVVDYYHFFGVLAGLDDHLGDRLGLVVRRDRH